nr:hypothetical protein WS71_28090 [Burkholderia mayonis]
MPLYIFRALKIRMALKVSAVSTAIIGLSSIQLLMVLIVGARGAKKSAPRQSETCHSNVQTIGTI